MKKFFLGAVAITAFLCSCDTSDDYTDKQETTNFYKERSENNMNSYELYQTILDGYVYDRTQSCEDNILLFEKYVNSKIKTDEYEIIERDQLAILSQTETDYVYEFNFSAEFKKSLLNLVENDINAVVKISDEKENDLFQMLTYLHINGNGDDKLWNDKRTIAFAYGAQFNIKKAILYAGAIELSTKK